MKPTKEEIIKKIKLISSLISNGDISFPHGHIHYSDKAIDILNLKMKKEKANGKEERNKTKS